MRADVEQEAVAKVVGAAEFEGPGMSSVQRCSDPTFADGAAMPGQLRENASQHPIIDANHGSRHSIGAIAEKPGLRRFSKHQRASSVMAQALDEDAPGPAPGGAERLSRAVGGERVRQNERVQRRVEDGIRDQRAGEYDVVNAVDAPPGDLRAPRFEGPCSVREDEQVPRLAWRVTGCPDETAIADDVPQGSFEPEQDQVTCNGPTPRAAGPDLPKVHCNGRREFLGDVGPIARHGPEPDLHIGRLDQV